jgi:acyl-ACP thioesterase
MSALSPTSQVWTEPLRVCSDDVDFTRRATGATLCRYFLEAAWNHAEALGLGFNQLASQGRLWVLSRLLVQVERYPVWGDAMVLRTWPRGVVSVFAMRDFEVGDDAGRRLAAGSSAWLVLNAATKRPQRLHKVIPSLAEFDGPSALGRDPEKLPDGEGGAEAYAATVRYTDTDVNRHVGSSRYVGWLLDAYPSEFHGDHALRVLEVNYLGETRVGDVVSIRTRQTAPGVYCHSVILANGSEVCRARLTWAKTPTQDPAQEVV